MQWKCFDDIVLFDDDEVQRDWPVRIRRLDRSPCGQAAQGLQPLAANGDVKDLFQKIMLMIGLRGKWLSLHRHIDDCGLQGSIGVDDVHKLGRIGAGKKEW